MNCRDDVIFLGSRYFSLVRSSSRRDLEGAEEFFGIPSGQAGYVIGNLVNEQLESVSGFGLPYRISNQAVVLSPGYAEGLAKVYNPEKVSELVGWQRGALELVEQHWWIARDWAKRDLGLAALMLGIKEMKHAEMLSVLAAKHMKAIAAETYTKMKMDGSLGMQSALLLADAEAAPDRVTVARCSSPLMAA